MKWREKFLVYVEIILLRTKIRVSWCLYQQFDVGYQIVNAKLHCNTLFLSTWNFPCSFLKYVVLRPNEQWSLVKNTNFHTASELITLKLMIILSRHRMNLYWLTQVFFLSSPWWSSGRIDWGKSFDHLRALCSIKI